MSIDYVINGSPNTQVPPIGTPNYPALALDTVSMKMFAAINGHWTPLNAAFPAYGLLSGLIGVTYDRIFVPNAGMGDIVLYTVPAGYRALIQLEAFNTAGSSTTWYPEVLILGNYYHYNPGIVTGAGVQGTNNGEIAFEPGDVIAINTSQAGLNVFGSVILFSTQSTLRTARVANMSFPGSTDTTVYTTPPGKKSLPMGFTPLINSSSSAGVNFSNQSGSSAAVHWNLVESGGSVATTNEFTAIASLTSPNVNGGTCNFLLMPGDFLSVNTNQTGQALASVTVWEGV